MNDSKVSKRPCRRSKIDVYFESIKMLKRCMQKTGKQDTQGWVRLHQAAKHRYIIKKYIYL